MSDMPNIFAALTLGHYLALGAVLPDLRAETQTLARDLAEMVRLKDAIGLERGRIAAEVEGLAGERVRLAALVDARQTALRAREASAGVEAKRAGDLAHLLEALTRHDAQPNA